MNISDTSPPPLPSYGEAWESAADKPPFSNGSMGEIWSYGNCERCVNDGMGAGDDEPQCPLILVALMGRTPAGWTDRNPPLGDYACPWFRERAETPPPAGDDLNNLAAAILDQEAGLAGGRWRRVGEFLIRSTIIPGEDGGAS